MSLLIKTHPRSRDGLTADGSHSPDTQLARHRTTLTINIDVLIVLVIIPTRRIHAHVHVRVYMYGPCYTSIPSRQGKARQGSCSRGPAVFERPCLDSFVDCLGISYMRLREADEKYKILGPGIQRSWHPALRTCLAQLSTL